MIRAAVTLAAGTLAIALAGAAAAEMSSETSLEQQLADCAARLDRSLAEMDARPLLKEELATGLMWIRLDARTAMDAGDAEACLAGARTAEELLGLSPPS